MAALSYSTTNTALLATWAAEASADTGYPATNIPLMTDLDRGNPGKLTIKSAGGWTSDYGAAQRLDVFVLWHNMDAGQTVQIQGNATNSWGSPSLTITLTAPAKREDGFTTKLFVDLRNVSGYTTTGYRWWRVHFLAPVNNSQFWGLKVWAGNLLSTLDRPVLVQHHVRERHRGLKVSTRVGYSWRQDLQTAPRALSGQILLKYATTWLALLSWYRSTGGPFALMLMIPDLTINDAWLAWFGADLPDGLVTDVLDFTFVTSQAVPVTVSFEEADAGGPEWT